MRKEVLILLSLYLYSSEGWAFISFGGYVPFGRSTQKEVDGSKNTLSFDPTVSFYRAFPFRTSFSHFILPELGFIFHGKNEYEDYSKRTSYLLLDLGFSFAPQWIFRYGLGTFITRIEGEGGNVTLGNGASVQRFYRPKQTTSSWNTTLNGGVEALWLLRWVPRFEFFLFSPLSRTARKVSYLLSLSYLF